MTVRVRRGSKTARPSELAALADPLGLSAAPAGFDGGFALNRSRILPQVVPPTLSEFCLADGRGLITVPFAGELSIAFVLDEEERYCYITAATAAEWGVDETNLMVAALDNLRRISDGLRWKQIGVGARALFLCETFDGYDASRILLSRELVHVASRVAGNLVLALPHRDYLIAIGDSDPEFVDQIRAGVQDDFLNGQYPITANLFTLDDTRVVLYTDSPNDRLRIN